MSGQKVTVYISNECEECEKVLSLLDKLDIDYNEKNTTKDKSYLKELQNEKIYATPVAYINDKKVLGFQENQLMHALGF